MGLLIEAGQALDRGVRLKYEHMLISRITDMVFAKAAFSAISKIPRNKFLLGPFLTRDFYAEYIFPGAEKISSSLSLPGLFRYKIPQAVAFGEKDKAINNVFFFISSRDVVNAAGLIGTTMRDKDRDIKKGERGGGRVFANFVHVDFVTLSDAEEIEIKDRSAVHQLRLDLTKEDLDSKVAAFFKEHPTR